MTGVVLMSSFELLSSSVWTDQMEALEREFDFLRDTV
jgi:hypothetical protein